MFMKSPMNNMISFFCDSNMKLLDNKRSNFAIISNTILINIKLQRNSMSKEALYKYVWNCINFTGCCMVKRVHDSMITSNNGAG